MMRIAIIGPGAIGILFAYALERSGIIPTLYYRNKNRYLDAIEEGGPRIKIRGRVYPLKAKLSYIESDDKSIYDIIIIATKAYDFEKALEETVKILDENGLVLSVQNGLGSLEKAEEYLGSVRTASAVITYGVTRHSLTDIEIKGFGEIYIGQRSVEENPLIKIIIKNLVKGGLNVKYVDDIDSYRWLKLLINSAIGPVTAIFRKENKVIIELDEAKKIAYSIIDEGIKIVDKIGIELAGDPYKEMINIVKKTSMNISSMLQDILSHKKTEIDYINGAIVKYGVKYNIPTPINNLMLYIVKGLGKIEKKDD